jgi:hypothetical protein
MPFKQGRRPCLVLSPDLHRSFRGTLLKSGYTFHTGPRTTRSGEIQAWVAPLPNGRQVHVQEVRRRNGNIAVFAHTEPEGYGLAHGIAAFFDRASYSGGGRALKADLRRDGWDV